MPITEYDIISRELTGHGIALDNYDSNPAIQDRMGLYMYTPEKIADGRTLYEEAWALVTAQKEEYGEQYQATRELYQAWAAAKAFYTPLLGVARVAFKKDANTRDALELDGARKTSIPNWTTQTMFFYNNLLEKEDRLAKMAQLGITEAQIQAGLEKNIALQKALSARKDERAEAIDATRARNKKLDELEDWMDDFKEIAKVALAGDPALLETLGY